MLKITREMHNTHFGKTAEEFLAEGYELEWSVDQPEYCHNVTPSGIREFMPIGPPCKKLVWHKNDDSHVYMVP